MQVKAAGTSITCCACGHVDRNSRESQAAFRCLACGIRLDADVNAARNVLARGLTTSSGAVAPAHPEAGIAFVRRKQALEQGTVGEPPYPADRSVQRCVNSVENTCVT